MTFALRRSVSQVVGKRKLLAGCAREKSTDANILTSVFDDVVIPKYTINEYVWQNLDRWPDKTITVCAMTGHGYTYAQTHRMSVCFAASLRKKLKLDNGDKVAVILPNIPEFPCTALGIIEAGCIPALMNPAYTVGDLKPQLEIGECKAVVTSKLSYANVSEALKQIKANIPIILVDNEDLPEGTIKFAEFAEDFAIDITCLKSVKMDQRDIGLLPFSSGTSGIPKAVGVTHRGTVALSEMIFNPSIIAVPESTESYQAAVPAVLPFFHIYGMNGVLINLMARGVKLVTMPVFKPELFLETIVRHKVEYLYLVPPMVLFLGKHPAVTPASLASVKQIICGAASLAKSDAEAVVNKNKNILFRQGYGLTETSGTISVSKNDDRDNSDSVGNILGSCEVKIVDPNTQKSLGPGQEGEIWFRGPNMMKGYYKNKAATDETITSDGWLKTGDIGMYNDNRFLYVTDRMKELIKVKGFQVAPAELESILRRHPKVADCAIIGVPDPIAGEVPKAFVVASPGQTVSEKEITEFVNSEVISFKNIKHVQFLDAIPKSAAGKILKKVLKKNYL